jgi:hypothetical protein
MAPLINQSNSILEANVPLGGGRIDPVGARKTHKT